MQMGQTKQQSNPVVVSSLAWDITAVEFAERVREREGRFPSCLNCVAVQFRLQRHSGDILLRCRSVNRVRAEEDAVFLC